MGRAQGGVRTLDLPGNEECRHKQNKKSGPNEEMGRIFEDIAGVEQNQGEPDAKAEPTQYCQNRTHLAVALDRRERQRRMGRACAPDRQTEPAVIQEQQHHDRVECAVHQAKI